ncbi:hypothetical protein Btru_074454 [Bulinus truncatus]|nr:hypothetical protein Btru_074454 [Bulinus truncatus]
MFIFGRGKRKEIREKKNSKAVQAIEKGQSVCDSQTPCKYQTKFTYANGTNETAGADNCDCPTGKQCRSGWSRPNYVLAIRTRSDVSFAITRYMFCDVLPSKPSCTSGQTVSLDLEINTILYQPKPLQL